ncbi:phosphate ABC transporter permease PstA [Rhabdochromatium marinum]|uniref:phosphate ABC transporter permease PstA n=1 Tax=Rhabdochromatium marinum TaxID=48729 RepID=UPI001906D910|nr:phosphate ABC transporter permease PstA [Rhabdochromatium marinum]MBK1649460.1 phosphate ABC transporter, permease protein PstA [Rhabdochromatium marinum]
MNSTPPPSPTPNADPRADDNQQDSASAGRRPIDIVNAGLKRRYAAEKRFRFMGATAVALGLTFVALLFFNIISNGYTAFQQTYVQLPVYFDPEVIDPDGLIQAGDLNADEINKELIRVNFLKLARDALRERFPEVKGRSAKRKLYGLLSPGVPQQLREMVAHHPELIGERRETWLIADDDVDMFMKGRSTPVKRIDTSGSATIVTVPSSDDTLQIISSGADFNVVFERMRTATPTDKTTADGTTLDSDMPSYLIAINHGLVKVESITAHDITGQVLLPLKNQDPATPRSWELLELSNPQSARRLKDQELAWVLSLKDAGALKKRFNTLFFTQGSSREPELAGIGGAFMGSLFTLTLTLLFSFPIAVGTAIYLEEFAPKNRWTDLIEININNLAAVPSIVFGLLGLAVFINFFGVPRSTPLVAAMVLTLMTLPTIIIASRAALKSVPPSIREAALGVGASPLQTQFHHVLPLAMPGMLTGTIIGMAQALGETAPLLMIGMIAFIVDIPGGFTDPSTVLPVQIFLWADSPERGFVERTSAAIMVLLTFLIMMNLLAVLLRRRFERRW